MYPHTKFGILTSKNLGDLHRTRSGTDGRLDGRTDSAITICLRAKKQKQDDLVVLDRSPESMLMRVDASIKTNVILALLAAKF